MPSSSRKESVGFRIRCPGVQYSLGVAFCHWIFIVLPIKASDANTGIIANVACLWKTRMEETGGLVHAFWFGAYFVQDIFNMNISQRIPQQLIMFFASLLPLSINSLNSTNYEVSMMHKLWGPFKRDSVIPWFYSIMISTLAFNWKINGSNTSECNIFCRQIHRQL